MGVGDKQTSLVWDSKYSLLIKQILRGKDQCNTWKKNFWLRYLCWKKQQ